jgi:hypothetical protein
MKTMETYLPKTSDHACAREDMREDSAARATKLHGEKVSIVFIVFTAPFKASTTRAARPSKAGQREAAMTKTRALLRRCERAGVRLGLTADGSRPTARWPVDFNDIQLKAELKAHRDEIVEAVRIRTFAIYLDGVVLERVISGGATGQAHLAVYRDEVRDRWAHIITPTSSTWSRTTDEQVALITNDDRRTA